jgi:proton-translocating NADH-quinone oxidoreductase chain L
MVMLLVIVSVSFLVHLFSLGYMGDDPHLTRFMSYLSLFTFFMIILVTADNFIVLFLGWEGVGLCSFLLISFWYTRLQAVKSALKAFVINRVGDLGLTMGIMFIYSTVQAVDFETIFSLTPYLLNTKVVFCALEFDTISAITFFLFVGATGKSAQIGLHLWLPDAMEGPTPVSALIHAATMVTAGNFLIIKCSPIFEYAPNTLVLITFCGGCTAFFCSVIGCLQSDLKKIIAYSTCAQLGYMFLGCGLSNYAASLLHFFNHAFFKAALFLSAGSLIHALLDDQDLSCYDDLEEILPFSYSVAFISGNSLTGTPFLSGSYSKDLIIETACTDYGFKGFFSLLLIFSGLALSNAYSVTTVSDSLSTSYSSFSKGFQEAPMFTMGLSLVVLLIGAIYSGFYFSELFLSKGSFFMGNSIFNLPKGFKFTDGEFLPFTYKLLGTCFGCSFFILAYYLSFFAFNLLQRIFYISYYVVYLNFFVNKNVKLSFLQPALNFEVSTLQCYYNFDYLAYLHFFIKKCLFDSIFNKYLAVNMIMVGYQVLFKVLDKGVLEVLGPKGFSNIIYLQSARFSIFQKGYIFYYLYIMLFATLSIKSTFELYFLLNVI